MVDDWSAPSRESFSRIDQDMRVSRDARVTVEEE
jgi:hypothetical protein